MLAAKFTFSGDIFPPALITCQASFIVPTLSAAFKCIRAIFTFPGHFVKILRLVATSDDPIKAQLLLTVPLLSQIFTQLLDISFFDLAKEGAPWKFTSIIFSVQLKMAGTAGADMRIALAGSTATGALQTTSVVSEMIKAS